MPRDWLVTRSIYKPWDIFGYSCACCLLGTWVRWPKRVSINSRAWNLGPTISLCEMQINKGVGWEGGGDGRKSLAHIVNKLYFLWIYFFIFSTHTVDRVFKATLTITIPTNFDLMTKNLPKHCRLFSFQK